VPGNPFATRKAKQPGDDVAQSAGGDRDGQDGHWQCGRVDESNLGDRQEQDRDAEAAQPERQGIGEGAGLGLLVAQWVRSRGLWSQPRRCRHSLSGSLSKRGVRMVRNATR
jgi:hypothetical protein